MQLYNSKGGQLRFLRTDVFAILFFTQLLQYVLGSDVQRCGYDANAIYSPDNKIYVKPVPKPLSTEQRDAAYEDIEARLETIAEGKLKKSSITNVMLADGSFLNATYNNSGWIRSHIKKLNGYIYKARENSTILELVKKSFTFMLNTNYKFVDDNWYWYLIGNPIKLWRGLFWMRHNVSHDGLLLPLFKKFWNDTREGEGNVWVMDCRSGHNSGSNFAPRALLGLVEHFIRNEPHLGVFVKELEARMTEELIDRRGYMNNSLRHDGCIHAHNMVLRSNEKDFGTGVRNLSHIYNANYGKEFLSFFSTVFWILDGTDYDLGLNITNALFNAFFECQQWLFRGKVVDPASLGRFIDSGVRMTYIGPIEGILDPLEYFKKMNHREDEVASALHRYNHVTPDDAHALIGNRNFFISDVMAHQRKHFMVTLRMSSRRCFRPESKYGLNKYGYFLGDGFMTLVLDTTEMGVKNKEVFQSFDWARIPGVTGPYYEPGTVPQVTTDNKNMLHMFSNHDFVGGVSDKNVGMAAMVLLRPPMKMTAKKSFLMLDDVILAMGSDIRTLENYDTSLSITTTMAQIIYDQTYSGCKGDIKSSVTIENHEAEDREWSSDLKTDTNFWIHHREVAYISLKSDGKLMSSAKEQEVQIKNSIFSAWIDHGNSPNKATYAYVVYPNISLEETIGYAQAPEVEVLKLDADNHVACDHTTKMQGMALFKASSNSIKSCLDLAFTSAEISTDKPCLLLAKMITDSAECSPDHKLTIGQPTNPSTLRISVADPTHLEATVDVTFIKDGTAHVQVVTLPENPKRGDSINICFFF